MLDLCRTSGKSGEDFDSFPPSEPRGIQSIGWRHKRHLCHLASSEHHQITGHPLALHESVPANQSKGI
jgi:hypothetical protein